MIRQLFKWLIICYIFTIDVMLAALAVCAHDRLHRRLPAEGKPLRAIVVHKKRLSARPTCKALQQGDFARSRDSRHRKQS